MSVLRKAYVLIALLALNSALLLLAANGIAHLMMKRLAPPPPGSKKLFNPITRLYSEEKVQKAYPGLSRDEMLHLLDETWERNFEFEPYTQFKEARFRGKYVNVHPAGFRIDPDQGPWPLAHDTKNLFVFGGSTAFGYGVADGDTVPARLQSVLGKQRVSVFNSARGNYFSSLERVLFESLLAKGIVPDGAVFIDGLNDFYNSAGNPYNSQFLYRLYGEALHKPAPEPSYWDTIALVRLARRLRNAKAIPMPEGRLPDDRQPLEDPTAGKTDPQLVELVIQRYLDNRKMIEAVCRAYGVKCTFVWQPVHTYKYDLAYHLYRQSSFGRHGLSALGYPVMAQLAKERPLGDDFVWCADIQESLKESLYVDQVHYSPKLANLLASCIAAHNLF